MYMLTALIKQKVTRTVWDLIKRRFQTNIVSIYEPICT